MENIEWTQILASAITVSGTLVLGRWAWSKLPKKDMGAAALATVQAAQQAVKLMDTVTDERMDQLEERVTVLENLVVEKEAAIKKLEAEIKRLLRWIAALIEQVHQAGGVPVSLEEILYLDEDEEKS